MPQNYVAPITNAQLKIIATPIMARYFDGVYKQRTKEWESIFRKKEGLKRAYHIEAMLVGFGNAPVIQDGAPMEFDQGGLQMQGNYKYLEVGLGFAISTIAMEDGGHIGLLTKFTSHLMQSMIETEELMAADVLNQGFTVQLNVTGLDGQPLFSAVHPTFQGTYSNILAGGPQLNYTSLQAMLIQISQARDFRNKPMVLPPQHLVVPPSLYYQAKTILESSLRPDTADNNKNVIAPDIAKGVKKITRLTSPTSWYLTTELPDEDLGLVRFQRREFTKRVYEDQWIDGVRVQATQRYVFSSFDAHGIYASTGIG